MPPFAGFLCILALSTCQDTMSTGSAATTSSFFHLNSKVTTRVCLVTAKPSITHCHQRLTRGSCFLFRSVSHCDQIHRSQGLLFAPKTINSFYDYFTIIDGYNHSQQCDEVKHYCLVLIILTNSPQSLENTLKHGCKAISPHLI